MTERKIERRTAILLSASFLFLCLGVIPALEGLFLLSVPAILIGCGGMVYGFFQIKTVKTGQFLSGFLGWFVVSFFMNMVVFKFLGSPQDFETGTLSSMVILQLLGCGLALVAFRKNQTFGGLGILLASLPYLVGFAAHSRCMIVGIPFPFSLIPLC